jgi:actin cytoskeleton-regulatory complex protein PAN1
MYSQSNSFVGGGNSARPAPGQFGQPQQSFTSFPQPQQQQQQQQPPFVSQPTGYGASSIQPQFTGYPGPGQQPSFQAPPQQPQFTGYPPQGQLLQQPSFPQPPPQQQSFPPAQVQQPPQPQPPQQPPAAPLRPQQTSSQIAQSFQSSSPASAAPVQGNKQSSKIPNIRLSFITATDQAKFEQLFKSAVGENKALDGKDFHERRGGAPLTHCRRESERSSHAFEVAR